MSPRIPSSALFVVALALAGLAACEPPVEAPPPAPEAKPITATPAPGQPGGPKATPKPGDWMFDKYKNPLEQKPGEKKKTKP